MHLFLDSYNNEIVVIIIKRATGSDFLWHKAAVKSKNAHYSEWPISEYIILLDYNYSCINVWASLVAAGKGAANFNYTAG